MDRQPDFVREVAVIACGIFFGGLMFASVAKLYMRYELNQAADAFKTSMGSTWSPSARAESRLSTPRVEMGTVTVRPTPTASTAEANQAAAAESRKEAAWRAFYHQPPQCERSTDFNVSVECGNAYIRAKKEFDSKWASQAQSGG